jgi:hypothetical protein
MWHMSPPIVRTNLARKALLAALKSKDECIVLALRTCAAFGDKSDIKTVEAIATQTESLATYYAAVHCLHELDSRQAIEFLRKSLVHEGKIPSLYAMEMLSAFGVAVDTTQLLKDFISVQEVGEDQFFIFQTAVKLLADHPLPVGGATLLKDAYKGSGPILRANIWIVAKSHRLEEFDSLALDILGAAHLNELGAAANFARERFILDVDRKKIALLCEQRIAELEPQVWQYSWDLRRMIDCLIAFNRKSVVSTILGRLLTKYLPEHIRVCSDWKIKVKSGFGVPDGTEDIKYNHFVQFELAGLLVPAAMVVNELPKEVVKSIVCMEISNSSDEIKAAFVTVVSTLSAFELDTVLEGLGGSRERVLALGYLSALGQTRVRLRLLIADLPAAIRSHLCYPALAKLVRAYWCDDLAEALISAVSTMTWPRDVGAQLFHDVEMVAAELISAEAAHRVLAPLLVDVSDSTSREILRFWHDVATTRRGGPG